MKLHVSTILGLLVALAICDSLSAKGPPEADRVKAIESMLQAKACGVGRPINDRVAWDALAKTPSGKKVIHRAEGWLGRPMPELTDELYLEFSRNGNRTRCQRVIGARHKRLHPLVVAECLENKGRFLDEIEKTILAICDEKTWVLPAHDRKLTNFKVNKITIDLASSRVGWDLATIDYWLGDRLTSTTRKRIHDELERRIFKPYELMVKKGKPRMWWLQTTNNWNAVCLANVTGTALVHIESRERRAFYIAAAEKYIQNFLDGFTDDGYCSEGIGYWNYGFGHFVMLAETLRQATHGQVDLMTQPKIEKIARFGRRMQVCSNIYPSFADCKPGSRPSSQIEGYVSRRFGFGWPQGTRTILPIGTSRGVAADGLWAFPNSMGSSNNGPIESNNALPLRDWFDKAQVLVCRPNLKNAQPFGVAVKGGHNNEHHNHNDVGSYIVVLGNHTPLVDPGNEVYTSRTFSGQRYQSKVLNSWGHSVPRVAGQLQQTGRAAAASVVRTAFTDDVDTLVLDLRAAYDVKTLKKLTRTFVFSRQGTGRFQVMDRVAFERPEQFGTALITFDTWKRTGANSLHIGIGKTAVDVQIDTQGKPFHITSDKIEEDLPNHIFPTRLGIELDKPVDRATISLSIRPAVQN